MPTVGNEIKFKTGTYQAYSAKLQAHTLDGDTLYFCTDTQTFHLGDKEYTRPVYIGNSAPTSDLCNSTPMGTLYFDGSSLYVNHTNRWQIIANNFTYTHPTTTAVSAAAVKVGKDSQGHVVLGSALKKSDVGLGNVENKSSSDIRGELTSSDVTTALGFTPTSEYTGTSPISVNNTTKVISHSTSGVTAGSKGDTTNQTPAFGGTFKVPSGTVDANGHLTAFADHTVTIPTETAVSFESDFDDTPTVLDYGQSFTIVSNVTRPSTSGSHTLQRTKKVYTLPNAPTIPSGAYYGVCTGQADEQIKDVTVSSNQHFNLTKGAIVGIKFTASNTYSSTSQSPVKLTFNSGETQYAIYYKSSLSPTGTVTAVYGLANYITYYMFDGTNLVWMGQDVDQNTDTKVTQSAAPSTGTYDLLMANTPNSHTAETATAYKSNVTYNAATHELAVNDNKVVTVQDIATDSTAGVMSASDKSKLDSLGCAYYGSCSATYADQAEKVITISNQPFQLKKGTIIGVYFGATNTFNATSESPITFKFNSSAESYGVFFRNGTATGTNPLAFGYASRLTYYMFNGTNRLLWMGTSYPCSAGTGINISNDLVVSVDTSTIATKTYADSAKATWTVIS